MDLDLGRFWEEERASRGKPFRTDKPRAPITISLDDHWLLDELQVESTLPYYQDPEVRAALNREANDRCDAEIGIRPFDPLVREPGPLRLERVLGCREEVLEGGTPWLEPAVETPSELARLLDRVEPWEEADYLAAALANGATVGRADGPYVCWSRGPATIATSVVGTTELMYALADEPELCERLFAVLGRAIALYNQALARAAGTEPAGLAVLDDNCALFSPGLYRRFCLPAMQTAFSALAPTPGHYRFQHSDSDMEHLLPILTTLGFHGVNFGPNVRAATIRAAMPAVEVHGQVAPFTLRDGSLDAIEAEVRRDFEEAGLDGGLTVTTAGSIPAGTTLSRIRHFMSCVDRLCRYA